MRIEQKFSAPPQKPTCRDSAADFTGRGWVIANKRRGGQQDVKIGKTLGIGTGTVQRVLMEQSRPFDVDAAEAALASQ